MTISRAVLALFALSLFLLGCGGGRVATTPAPAAGIAVVPKPVHLSQGSGAFKLDSTTFFVASGDEATRIAGMLAARVRSATGFGLPVGAAPATSGSHVRFTLDPSRADLGDEGYSLSVRPESVLVTARAGAGLFHGMQTLRQLLPVKVESDIGWDRTPLSVPAVEITDYPRYAWRGAMLDVSRHFFTVDEVKQFIDLLAMYKFNTLHLHLSDDQGWRMAISSRPNVTGAQSTGEIGPGEGGFYTQADYSAIVKYAADRYILIVPEIEMPAHASALIRAYPQIGCGALCPDSSQTFQVIDDVVREVASLTPGPYLHIGGDENDALTHDQYIRYVDRAQEIVRSHGKRMIGWEEITQAHLDPSTIVQLWRTDSSHTAVAQRSPHLILSPADKIYMDMKYSAATELGLDWAGLVTVKTSYDWNPATYVAGADTSLILGIEAPLWTETVRNLTAAEFMTVPRLPAVSEVAWTPQASRSWDDFRARIATQAPRWRLLGINYFASDEISWR